MALKLLGKAKVREFMKSTFRRSVPIRMQPIVIQKYIKIRVAHEWKLINKERERNFKKNSISYEVDPETKALLELFKKSGLKN